MGIAGWLVCVLFFVVSSVGPVFLRTCLRSLRVLLHLGVKRGRVFGGMPACLALYIRY